MIAPGPRGLVPGIACQISRSRRLGLGPREPGRPAAEFRPLVSLDRFCSLLRSPFWLASGRYAPSAMSGGMFLVTRCANDADQSRT